MKTSSFLAVALLATTGMFAAVTKASPITIDVKYNGMVNGAESINASYNRKSSNVLAGMISFDYSNLSGPLPFTLEAALVTFCIEFSQSLNTNQTMQYTISSADQWFGAQQADAIARLYSGFGSQTGTASSDAAFQLALWELIYDYNDNNWNDLSLKSGDFQIKSNNASAALATRWLSEIVNVSSQHTLYVMTNAQSQNQLIFTDNPLTPPNNPLQVSAPATLGVFSLGLLGMALRRRQR